MGVSVNIGDGIFVVEKFGVVLDLMDDVWWGLMVLLVGKLWFVFLECNFFGLIIVNMLGK